MDEKWRKGGLYDALQVVWEPCYHEEQKSVLGVWERTGHRLKNSDSLLSPTPHENAITLFPSEVTSHSEVNGMTMALLMNYLDPSLSLTIAGGLFAAPYAPLVSLKCTKDSAETVCKACRLTAAQDSCVPWGRTLAASPAMQTRDKWVKNNRDKVTLSCRVPLLLCSADSIFLNENHVFPFFLLLNFISFAFSDFLWISALILPLLCISLFTSISTEPFSSLFYLRLVFKISL